MNVLTAAEVIVEGNKPGYLPDTGGMKYFKYDPECRDQEDSVDTAMTSYSECLKEQRVCRKMNLSVADWKKDKDLALVKVMKGSTLQKFGFQTRDGKFLFPEECLFLIEQGILELYYNSLPTSLQEAHMLLLPLLPTFEYYQVYSHLCRLGYLVNRYKKMEKDVAESSHPWDRAKSSVTDTDLDFEETDTEEEKVPDCLKSRYMKTLWRGPCVPLIKPSQATCTAAVLSKLKSSQITHLKDYSRNETVSTRLKIDFDVYNSKEIRKQAKNIPDRAQFRIAVCSYVDHQPSLDELAYLTQESGDVHLKIGVVNQGTVSFYGMFSVDLPAIITQP